MPVTVGTQATQRLGNEAAATADVEHLQTAERAGTACGQAEMAGKLIADEREAGRADLMQGPKFAGRVPPGLGQTLKALDLGGV